MEPPNRSSHSPPSSPVSPPATAPSPALPKISEVNQIGSMAIQDLLNSIRGANLNFQNTLTKMKNETLHECAGHHYESNSLEPKTLLQDFQKKVEHVTELHFKSMVPWIWQLIKVIHSAGLQSDSSKSFIKLISEICAPKYRKTLINHFLFFLHRDSRVSHMLEYRSLAH